MKVIAPSDVIFRMVWVTSDLGGLGAAKDLVGGRTGAGDERMMCVRFKIQKSKIQRSQHAHLPFPSDAGRPQRRGDGELSLFFLFFFALIVVCSFARALKRNYGDLPRQALLASSCGAPRWLGGALSECERSLQLSQQSEFFIVWSRATKDSRVEGDTP